MEKAPFVTILAHMSQASPLILAFGDSLIAGYGLAATESFPHQLERRLQTRHPGAAVINAGRSGDTTASALQRLPGVLATLRARPDLAIVQLGANDLLHGVAPARTREQLDRIVTEIMRCGIPVLLATVTPPAFLHQRVTDYLTIHREIAARHDAALCDFFPAGVLGHPEMVLRDRIHPNARAIARVVDMMVPAVEHELTKRAGAGRHAAA